MDLDCYKLANHGNAFVDSTIPQLCQFGPCLLGIDEAGRGPVLGPMVYGVCYCPLSHQEDLNNLGAADSKTLSEVKREELFALIKKNNHYIGWSMEVISPQYISNCMYKRDKVSLNEISQNSAATLVQRVIDAGANIKEIYVDTVGDPQKYQARLQDIFPTILVTVSKKADSLFPIVSAASICAKVARDKALREWHFPEEIEITKWGSGYPGDSVTKNFLLNSIDSIFGFPSLVRFSWSTAEKIIEEKCIPGKWENLDDKEEKAPSVLAYFSKKRKLSDDEKDEGIIPPILKRHNFFEDRFLKNVSF